MKNSKASARIRIWAATFCKNQHVFLLWKTRRFSNWIIWQAALFFFIAQRQPAALNRSVLWKNTLKASAFRRRNFCSTPHWYLYGLRSCGEHWHRGFGISGSFSFMCSSALWSSPCPRRCRAAALYAPSAFRHSWFFLHLYASRVVILRSCSARHFPPLSYCLTNCS